MNRKIGVYSKEVEQTMNRFYASLGERPRRHYAAVESEKIGYGGGAYIMSILGISRNTLSRGIKELCLKNSEPILVLGGHRQEGGGRKKKEIQTLT